MTEMRESLQHDFTVELLKCLREEIMDCIESQRRAEVWCIFAMAALYVFYVTHMPERPAVPDLPKVVWFIPTVFSLFGLARVIALHVQISVIAGYLRKTELEIRKEGFWEEFLYHQRKGLMKINFLGYTYIVSFLFLLIGSLVVGIVACLIYY